jgi:hypothetical protein
MAEIESYTGNAGLGLGSNPGMPLGGPNDNLKVIQDTGRDIMLLDADRNTKLFGQKIKDRDQLTQLILDNKVSTKNIDESYLPEFLKVKKKTEDAYNEWGGNFNDIKGYKKYQDTVGELQDYAAHSQTNTAVLTQLKKERAAETLPWKQKSLDQWIEQESGKTKKDPWAVVDPYHQLFSFSLDPILKTYTTKTTSVSSPDGLWKQDVTTADYPATLKKANIDYLANDKEAEDQREWLNQYDNYDEPQKKRSVNAINSQLEKYNASLGLTQGMDGYAEPVQMVMGPDNKLHIKESPATFAAKYALSNQSQYINPGERKFQKDFGAYQKGLMDEGIKKAKLGVDWFNAETRRGALTLKQRAAENMTDDQKSFSQTYDNIAQAIQLPEPSSYKLMGGGDKFSLNIKDIPQGATYLQGIGANGQPLQLLPKGVDFSKSSKDPGIVRDKSGNVLGYKGENGHYDTNYFVPAGTVIGNKKVAKDIQLSPKELYKLYDNSGYNGSFKDFVNDKFKGHEIDYKIEGSNGTADRVSSYVSQKALSNKLTKKGQESPYAADELDLIMSQGDSPDAPDENPGQ